MTPERKAALAEGRKQHAAINNYLEALRRHQPKRGRKRTPETVSAQLEAARAKIAEGGQSAIDELNTIQTVRDLEKELSTFQRIANLDELEDEFVSVALVYSQRKGIDRAAWRAVGVEPAVLLRAGIK